MPASCWKRECNKFIISRPFDLDKFCPCFNVHASSTTPHATLERGRSNRAGQTGHKVSVYVSRPMGFCDVDRYAHTYTHDDDDDGFACVRRSGFCSPARTRRSYAATVGGGGSSSSSNSSRARLTAP
uniref:Uncharacterized protein n=1 Tax=Anopheles quadriannulatus TaxID=34691 RepID=A0A182XEM6_ANOQN